MAAAPVLLALGFVALATIRWDAWVGAAATQVTDDAYVRSDLTHLSSRIAGEVLVVAVNDWQRVKAGDLLVEVDAAADLTNATLVGSVAHADDAICDYPQSGERIL